MHLALAFYYSIPHNQDWFACFTDEITASFRRFGHLFVDWPHKAESKSYFPPKGEPNRLDIVSASTVTLQHHLPVQQCALVPTLSRICILAVSRWKLCPGPHWRLHSGGWKAVPVRLQPHHQRQACEFGTLFICCLQVIHLGQQEHKCSLTHTKDLCYGKSDLGKLESSVLLRFFYSPVWGLL